jgi:two-component system, NarL family, response regulator DegU
MEKGLKNCFDVLVVEEDFLLRCGMHETLRNIEFIGKIYESNDRKGVERLMKRECIDVVLLGVNSKVDLALETFKFIKVYNKNIKLIVFTISNSKKEVISFIDAGVNAILQKSAEGDEIHTAIQIVLRDGVYIQPQIYKIWYDDQIFQNGNKLKGNQKPKLTAREEEIIVLICGQYSTKQIAQKLFVEEITISNHRYNIMRKLNVNNVVGIVLYAVRTGLYIP